MAWQWLHAALGAVMSEWARLARRRARHAHKVTSVAGSALCHSLLRRNAARPARATRGRVNLLCERIARPRLAQLACAGSRLALKWIEATRRARREGELDRGPSRAGAVAACMARNTCSLFTRLAINSLLS